MPFIRVPFTAGPIYDFDNDVKLNLVPNYEAGYKFGRNTDIDTGTTPEDITELGTGLYTGFPTDAPATVDVYSDNANDTLLGSGSRTVRLTGLLTSESVSYSTEDIDMDGLGHVTSGNTWYRINRVKSIDGTNAGVITVERTADAGVVFSKMSIGVNSTLIGAYTVPADRTMLIENLRLSLTRANGSLGSAEVTLRVRAFGSNFWDTIDYYDIVTSNPSPDESSYKIPAKADLVFRCEDVSDNNSTLNVKFDYKLVVTE